MGIFFAYSKTVKVQTEDNIAHGKSAHGFGPGDHQVKAPPYRFSPDVRRHTRAPSSHRIYQVEINATLKRVKHKTQRVDPPIAKRCHAWPTSFAREACSKEREGASKSLERVRSPEDEGHPLRVPCPCPTLVGRP